MPLNFVKFFTPSYFLDLRPVIDPGTLKFLMIGFGIMAVAGVVLKIIVQVKKFDHYQKNIFNKYFQLLLTVGLLGEFYVWCRYELAYFFSARFWLVVLAATLAIWLYYILKYQIKVVPQARVQAERTKIFNQYLPKKK